jgi:hypothetical protein
MRLLAIGLGIGVIVFVLTAGHVVFLPLLFLPLGLFSLGHRRHERADRLDRRQNDGLADDDETNEAVLTANKGAA